MFSFVHAHFENFLKELALPFQERLTAEGKANRIAKSLFTKYYPYQDFTRDCYLMVGSYGKALATKPRTDLDMLFVLPADVYTRV